MPHRPGMDADGDGAVSLTEFRVGFAARLLCADANGDGSVAADELTQARERRRWRRH